MVVLAGRSLFDSLSLGGLACRELASVGRAVIGTAPLSCGGAVHEGYREHAVHWAEAGGVLEEMLSALESGSRCTHVFGFGPWAAAAMQPIADLLPGAKRIVVDDSGELCAPDEDSYWNDSRAWLEHLDVTVIRVRDIFDALPPPQWPADSVRRLSGPLHAELRDKRVILLDEASDRPPAPEVLEAALRRWDHEKDRLVLSLVTLPSTCKSMANQWMAACSRSIRERWPSPSTPPSWIALTCTSPLPDVHLT